VLSSTVTGELLRKLRREFEYVLVDSPPLLSVADSRILATMTDATVLVVLAYSSPYDIVLQAKNSLYKAGDRVLGVALNKVDFQRDGYGYGYYYRYCYGYGNGNGDDPDGQDSRDNVKEAS
jgi:Mrp family chromosome partitioning ATPase